MNLFHLDRRLLLQGEHCYLDTTDVCYFVDEYEGCERPGLKPQILSMKRGNKTVISAMARELDGILPFKWTAKHTFVAMPPSAGNKSHLSLMLRQLNCADHRAILVQTRVTRSSHCGWRPTPAERSAFLAVDEAQTVPKPTTVVVVDDVLATGAHFRAAKNVIRHRWPGMRVIGITLARVCWRRGAICSQRRDGGAAGACPCPYSRAIVSREWP
jgi:hypothetical protein